MSTVLSLLGRFGALAGIIVIAYLIWSYGSYIPPLAPTRMRVIVIAVLIGGYALVQVFKWWRNKKKSAEISKDLAQAADAADPNAEQSREEMAELKDRFDEALKTLKKSTVGGKKVKSIYQLPWYIIIGPPGSGKTTLLINSGLQFPLAEAMGDSKVQGVGGTRYCDWWFTDEAVLIDTAGRYTTQDSNQEVDNSAWLSFLGLLKKHRRRRPINGIILAISLEELLRQSDVDRERNAKAVTERIQELYEELGVRFPVYLMFTKCDLMAGFMEFYGNLDRYERAQVWGFTYPMEGPKDKRKPLDGFDEQFDTLLSQLNNHKLERMAELKFFGEFSRYALSEKV